MVWMRTAGLPNFRKLYGKLDQDMEGSFHVAIENNYDVEKFEGKKSFVLSTSTSLGGQNYFLAYCYVVFGIFCIIFALIFLVAHCRQ